MQQISGDMRGLFYKFVLLLPAPSLQQQQTGWGRGAAAVAAALHAAAAAAAAGDPGVGLERITIPCVRCIHLLLCLPRHSAAAAAVAAAAAAARGRRLIGPSGPPLGSPATGAPLSAAGGPSC